MKFLHLQYVCVMCSSILNKQTAKPSLHKTKSQPRRNIFKDEKDDLIADSHSIVARWRNYFTQLLNVHGVRDVGQVEIHTADPLVPEPSAFEAELLLTS